MPQSLVVVYSAAPAGNSQTINNLTPGHIYVVFASFVNTTTSVTLSYVGATSLYQTSETCLNYRNVIGYFTATSSTVTINSNNNKQAYTTIWRIE